MTREAGFEFDQFLCRFLNKSQLREGWANRVQTCLATYLSPSEGGCGGGEYAELWAEVKEKNHSVSTTGSRSIVKKQ